jgi:hypothetical protein
MKLPDDVSVRRRDFEGRLEHKTLPESCYLDSQKAH